MKTTALLGLSSLLATTYAHSDMSGRSTDGIDVSGLTLPDLSTYTPSDEVKKDPKVAAAAAAISARSTYVERAVDFVKKTVPGVEFRVLDGHHVGSNGIGYVNLKQTVHGVDIDNGDFKVNVHRDGSIFSFGNGFFDGKLPQANPLARREFNNPLDALKGAITRLGLPVNADRAVVKAKGSDSYTVEHADGALQDPKVDLRYLITDKKNLSLVWRVETDVGGNWIVSFVDAKDSSKVHAAFDYTAHAAEPSSTFQVYPWNLIDPSEGDRIIVNDPWDDEASPFGWLSDGKTKYNTTWGNNAYAHSNPNERNFNATHGTTVTDRNEFRPTVTNSNFTFSLDLEDEPQEYTNATITQLFYTVNKLHDVLYHLGFNEASGNFQFNNADKGGKGGDAVSVNAQDGAGFNNANFQTPVDGQSPRMRMYLFNNVTPKRDGALDQSVVVHEYSHGLSTRLTGGADNDGCLDTTEARGLGEGWSDFVALAIETKTTRTRDTVVQFGAYTNKGKAIRQYPYTTDTSINKHTYASINADSEVHAVGSVWTAILYEVFWNLIDKYGHNNDDLPTFDAQGVPTDGRFLALKLVIDGLSLQPCRPNFLQARDAIIDADKALTDSANVCEIWKGFAKRGLGTDAKRVLDPRSGTYKAADGFKIPKDCEEQAKQ